MPSPLSNGTTADATAVMADLNSILDCTNTALAPLVHPTFSGNVGIGTTAVHALDVSGSSTLNGYAFVGSNASPLNTQIGDLTTLRLSVGNRSITAHGPEEIAEIYGTLTQLSGSGAIAAIVANIAPLADSAGSYRSFWMSANYNTANNLTGTAGNAPTSAWFENRITNAGTIAQVNGTTTFGLLVPSAGVSLGSVSQVDAGYFQSVDSFGNTLTSVVTNAIGVHVVDSAKASLSITNQAGIVVDALSAATNNTGLLLGQSAIPSGSYGVYDAAAGNNYFAGNVGIGTNAPSQKLEVNGAIKIDSFGSATATPVCQLSGVLSLCSSSRRYKENISDSPYGLKEVEQLRPVTFTWKGRAERDFGFIAEEVERINPLFVTYKANTVEGVKYSQLVAVLTKAVQEQEREIQDQRNALEQLARQTTSQQLKIKQLERDVVSLRSKGHAQLASK